MATYNGQKYLKCQLDSIIQQTYRNWQLIIRDDCSKDNTVKIIQEYEKKDDRIKVIDNEGKNLDPKAIHSLNNKSSDSP